MLQENTNTKIYLNIVNGKIAQKVEESTSGARSRKNKNGVEVWEKLYNSVSGTITSLKMDDSQYGKQLKVGLNDGELLTIPVASAYFSTFVNKIGNVKLAKEVKIAPYNFEAEGKKKSGITIYQDGEKVEWFISKDNQPKGYPAYPAEKDDSAWKKYLIDKEDWEVKYIDTIKLSVSPGEAATSLSTDDFMDEGKEEIPF